MAKSLCELKKSIRGDLAAYARLVVDHTHVCRRCGRVANRKKLLCKPMRLDDLIVALPLEPSRPPSDAE